MKKLIVPAAVVGSILFGLTVGGSIASTATAYTQTKVEKTMHLGAFSVSLAVKDLEKSRVFYQKLGFETVGGNASQGWLILRNADTITIGLFHGMFDRNLLTFNPGWTSRAENLDGFTDIREIQKILEARGLELTTRADEKTKGPASLTLADPDGNPILIDQHR